MRRLTKFAMLKTQPLITQLVDLSVSYTFELSLVFIDIKWRVRDVTFYDLKKKALSELNW